jgi:hypothetical protein
MIDDPSKPLTLWIVNDRLQAYPKAVMRWRMNGRDNSQVVDIAADGVQKVVALGPATDVARGTTTLEVSIEDSEGNVLGRNRLERPDFIHWKQ